jgi:WD40 repeat protein
VSFNQDGLLVSGSLDCRIVVWDMKKILQVGSDGMCGLVRVLSGHTGPVLYVSFSPDGKRIASGSGDRTIRVWEAATGRPLAVLKGHSSPVESAVWSNDGSRIASGSLDKSVCVWRIDERVRPCVCACVHVCVHAYIRCSCRSCKARYHRSCAAFPKRGGA